MISHEIDYKIFGDDIQFVEIELDPGRNSDRRGRCNGVYGTGRLLSRSKWVTAPTPNQGLMGKLFSAGSRIITGESLFLTHFTNQGL